MAAAIVITLGPPALRWAAGTPALQWATEALLTQWATGSPQTDSP